MMLQERFVVVSSKRFDYLSDIERLRRRLRSKIRDPGVLADVAESACVTRRTVRRFLEGETVWIRFSTALGILQALGGKVIFEGESS
jgi:hypothetical protein